MQKETFCISQNEKFSFYSATLQNDTLYIGLNLGRILYSVQILIVSKLMQNVSFSRDSNCVLQVGRIKSELIILLRVNFYGLAIHSATILHAAEYSPSSCEKER